jgi:mono/diheme cytochrome c family protein
MTKRWAVFAILVLTLCSSACSRNSNIRSSGNSSYGSALIEVSGSKQAASVGSTLDQPLVVQANDEKGSGAPNVPVHFSGPGGVLFNPDMVLTDSSGQASTAVSIGSSPGRYKIEAWLQDRAGKRIVLPLEEIALGYEQVLGREVAIRYCNRCHDQESTAERVSNYENLKAKPHALSDGDTLNRTTGDELFSIIAHGGPALNRSAEMPAFGFTLAKSDLQAVLSYMRAVSDPPYRSKGVVYAQK